MISRRWKASDSRRTGRTRAAALSVCAALAVSAAMNASAVTFYKWTDKDGGVHYGDAPPKGFHGKVTRVDVDPAAHAVAPPAAPSGTTQAVPALPEAAPTDMLTQRRETRARLEQNLAQARARLDLARKALAEATEPNPDEWQFVQGVRPAAGSPQVARSNCYKTTTGTTVCPSRVPNEQYFQRLDRLQAEVEAAQKAVDEAEVAYRRGVD